ncbi:SLOG domain-containing protein [Mesorhizobium sp. 43Arga]
MSDNNAIFLSASIPDPRRGPEYAKTADTVAITAAVSSLIHVTLGRRLLVWGGHPAITPMIWEISDSLGLEYGAWVKLYQSRYFEDEFPEDNKRFQNVTYTEIVDNHRDRSLLAMRRRMFSDYNLSAAVFIGGMRGIVDEFELIRDMHPKARMVPVISTGGATLEVGKRLGRLPDDLLNSLDYIALFHRHLGISVQEERYRRPEDQPKTFAERLWRREDSAPPAEGQ